MQPGNSERESGDLESEFSLYLPIEALYAPIMKVGEILRMLQDDGWYHVATRGSHRQFKHPTKPGRVTVAGKPGDDIAPGTLNSIYKQTGWKK